MKQLPALEGSSLFPTFKSSPSLSDSSCRLNSRSCSAIWFSRHFPQSGMPDVLSQHTASSSTLERGRSSLHDVVRSLVDAELTFLKSVVRHSASQHRSQLFTREMFAIIRLAKLLRRALDGSPSGSLGGPSASANRSDARLFALSERVRIINLRVALLAN